MKNTLAGDVFLQATDGVEQVDVHDWIFITIASIPVMVLNLVATLILDTELNEERNLMKSNGFSFQVWLILSFTYEDSQE